MPATKYESLVHQIRAEFSLLIDDLPKSEGHFAEEICFSESTDSGDRIIFLNLYCHCGAHLAQLCCLPLILEPDDTVASEMTANIFINTTGECSKHVLEMQYSQP